MIRIRTSRKDLADIVADVAACFAYEGDRKPRGVKDPKLRKKLAEEMKAERFKGRKGDLLIWNGNAAFGSHRFLVVGLGPVSVAVDSAVREGCARAIRAAERLSAERVALFLPPADAGGPAALARTATEGALLGAYRFEEYLTDPSRRRDSVKNLEVAVDGAPAQVKRAVRLGEVTARAVYLARDLVNQPPSIMNPAAFARHARTEARRSGLACKVMGPGEIRKRGMSALLAVARGSNSPAQVVHLTYKPKRKAKRRIVLVGKGVTFDSGGLNLKPGNSMLTMKGDMAGAAAVLATMTALRELDCPMEVHGLLGLVENMTGAAAYKPGDILSTLSGKTVEVGNTDAEGRLVLCDLLAHAAKRLKPDRMIDVATLTGACVVALGPKCAGVFSRDEALRNEVVEAAGQAGEKVWPLPMLDEYLDFLQDGPADLKNVGGRWGGAITAALFLGEFLPKGMPWLHLDIAGPAFAERDAPDAAAGGTGAGVRTLLRWFESR
ncbi:MAG: leucyl aminopeptidase [Acidobacteriota bacterium]|nr:leucyl aminopeptidase [Acidobacteriota bacterium]